MKEQLGLKLDAIKTPREILVIDRVGAAFGEWNIGLALSAVVAPLRHTSEVTASCLKPYSRARIWTLALHYLCDYTYLCIGTGSRPSLPLLSRLRSSRLAQSAPTSSSQALPRTADGKPNFEGIWQAVSTAGADLQDHAASLNMLAGRSVIAGDGKIPYQPWAAQQKAANFKEPPDGRSLQQVLHSGAFPASCIWIIRFRSSRRRR